MNTSVSIKTHDISQTINFDTKVTKLMTYLKFGQNLMIILMKLETDQ
jgi:hypothetical protein